MNWPVGLTRRDMETLVELVDVCDAHLPNNSRGRQSPCRQTSRGEGATPLDVGGGNGSHHSYTLTKLARKGYAEHKKLGGQWGDLRSTGYRGSKVYRPTDAGRNAAAEFKKQERLAREWGLDKTPVDTGALRKSWKIKL